IYLECRREVRLDLVQGEYDYPGTADAFGDMTTVVMNRAGEHSPTAALTDGIGFDDPEVDESAGPSPFSLADDDDEDGDGCESTTGAQPSPPLPPPADENELPEPHYIPYEYCQVRRTLNIGLIGTSSSGKSHLLAAM